MMGLAWPSLRHRLPSFTATFVAILLSTLVVGAFATLVETATGPVSGEDRTTLIIMGAVIGGWGAMIAMFSLVSTLSVAVRRRDVEIGLLRVIGATPRQARRMVRTETAVVALAAALTGAVVAWPAGRALLAMIRDGGLVAPSVEYGGGVAALGATMLVVILTSLIAAGFASRRATRASARLALAEEVGTPPLSRWRRIAGLVLIGYAVATGFVTVFVTGNSDDPYAAMQTSGSASILAGVGLAAFAPVLLRGAARLGRPLMDRGAAGHLAGFNAGRRAHLLGPVLGPVIVFTAATAGTLMLVGIDSRTLVLPPDMTAAEADTITLLNNVVVGMIAVFAAIMLVNALLAVVGDRAAEFGRLRLVGGTPDQIRASVLAETLLVSGVGAVLGLVASLATIVPFSIARDEGFVPDGQLWLPVVVAAVAVVLTVGAGRIAVRRALGAGSAVEVVAAT